MTSRLFLLVGTERTLQVAGVELLGFNASNGRKFLVMLAFFVFLYILTKGLRWLARKVGRARQKVAFWTGQGISLVSFLLAGVAFGSIWLR